LTNGAIAFTGYIVAGFTGIAWIAAALIIVQFVLLQQARRFSR
jgi:hypothetical protein